jgi:predicted dithiol-disulfide oxidoreductase (DUF899 family)
LPWIRIDEEYVFDTDEGERSLRDLFAERSQLLVYHFMFGPEWSAGCPSCSSIADGFNSFVVHLANHDVMLWVVSRAPLAKVQAYERRMGWTFPWASSFRSDFNLDFKVHITEEQQRTGDIEYNYRREAPTGEPPAEFRKWLRGTDAPMSERERPGLRPAGSPPLVPRRSAAQDRRSAFAAATERLRIRLHRTAGKWKAPNDRP